jgi:hypothetical protein
MSSFSHIDPMTRAHSAVRTTFVALAASVLLSAPAAAQQGAPALRTSPVPPSVPTDSAQRAPAASAVGPTVEASRVAVQRQPSEATAPAAAPRGGYGQPVALMVVGGVAMLSGLIIGGDAGTAIAIGGVVVGLIGLYQYLQ